MKRENAFLSALGIAALPLGVNFASGRATALFYAQTADAAWLGILVSGLCFAIGMFLFSGCSRCRWGRWAGWILALLRLLLTAMLLWEAAHIGMLVLPLQHAALYAVIFAALLCAAVVLSGRRFVLGLGTVYGLCLALFLCLLQSAPDAKPVMRCAVELRLDGCIPAALLLGICHGALSACIAAPLCGLTPVCSGILYTLLLCLSNAVFMRRNPMLLRLKSPFAALAAGWGTAGFCLSALLIFLGCIAALSGILYGSFSERKCRNFSKNRC